MASTRRFLAYVALLLSFAANAGAQTPPCADQFTAIRTQVVNLKSKYISVKTDTALVTALDKFKTDGCVAVPAAPPPPPPSSMTVNVAPGADLQAAINQAQDGQTLVLQAGATYSGNFTLPKRSGTGVVTIRTSATLPDRRVTPSDTALLAKLVSQDNQSPIVTTADGGAGWVLVGLQLEPLAADKEMIALGGDRTTQKTVEQQPRRITIDRCFFRGSPTAGQHRGIRMNGADITVTRSYFKDFFEVGRDSQAIAGWNGSGPFIIEDNYMEASGENFILGGSDCAIQELCPGNLTFRDNYLTKPLAWKTSSYQIKNLFELKMLLHGGLVENNVFENSWPGAQAGFLVLFTGRSQEGTNPWAVVENLTFQYNVIRHGLGAFQLMGKDYYYPSGTMHDVKIQHNVIYDIYQVDDGFGGNFMTWTRGGDRITIDHNTVDHAGNILMLDDGAATNATITNNIWKHNKYGVAGAGTGQGTAALNAFLPGVLFMNNVIANPPAGALYPAGNFLPTLDFAAQFDAQHRLQSGGVLFGYVSTDGKKVGADVDALIGRIPGLVW